MGGTEEREQVSDDLGTYSVDDEDQLEPEDTLIQDGVEDVLDRGYSPPDTDRGSRMWGTTAAEQHGHESLDQRILQEEEDPCSAYGRPHNESGLDTARLGGDDPDAIDADEDWIGDREVGSQRAGRLVAPDEGAHEDHDGESWGRDVGIDGAGASAEEAAMHVIDDEDYDG
ncbi:MAG: DUF5709 domain-containing protein [Micrococcales bacterium]|nr:DUF5709 domain-containing protein [Micrococcales bacterium]